MDKIKPAFEALNEQLSQSNINTTLICVGGYVLEYHGLRATQDIDAFYEETQALRQIIQQVGDQFNLNTKEELWINNSVSNLNQQPPLNICQTLYSFSNLTVLIAPIEYVLGMKMFSGREQDLQDIGEIIKYKQLTSPFDLFEQLKKLGFNTLDFSILLEGFSYAYGMEWLEKFFESNQNEIKKYY